MNTKIFFMRMCLIGILVLMGFITGLFFKRMDLINDLIWVLPTILFFYGISFFICEEYNKEIKRCQNN